MEKPTYLNNMKPTSVGQIAGNIKDDRLQGRTPFRAQIDNMNAINESYSKITGGVDNFLQTYYTTSQKLSRGLNDNEKNYLSDVTTKVVGKQINFSDDYSTWKNNILTDKDGKQLPINKQIELVKSISKNMTSIDSPYVTFKSSYVNAYSELFPITQSINSEIELYKKKSAHIKKTNDAVLDQMRNEYRKNTEEIGLALDNTISKFVGRRPGEAPEYKVGERSKPLGGDLEGTDKDAMKYMIFNEIEKNSSLNFLAVGDLELRNKLIDDSFAKIKARHIYNLKQSLEEQFPNEPQVIDWIIKTEDERLFPVRNLLQDAYDEVQEEYIKNYSDKGTSLMQNPELGETGSSGSAVEGHIIDFNTGVADNGYVAFLDVALDVKRNQDNVIAKFGTADEKVNDGVASLIMNYAIDDLINGRHLTKDGVPPRGALSGKLSMQNIAAGDENTMAFTFDITPMYLLENKTLAKMIETKDPETYTKLTTGELDKITVFLPKDNLRNLYYKSTLPSTEDVLLNSSDSPGLNFSNNSGSFINIKKQDEVYNLDINLKYISGVDDEGNLEYQTITHTNQAIPLPPEGFYDGKLIANKYNYVLAELEKVNYEILQELRKMKKKGKSSIDLNQLKAYVNSRLMM